MSARRAVPQVGYLAQVLRQVILVVRLSGQLQVATERVQPHRISPAETLQTSVGGHIKDLTYVKASKAKMVHSDTFPDLWRKKINYFFSFLRIFGSNSVDKLQTNHSLW